MLIKRTSRITGLTHIREIPVTQEQLDLWRKDGVVIQNAMPNISPEDREFIISGITPEEWKQYVYIPEE
jgi:hypothetical protein